MKKFALFAFNGELMCFVHVLLNAFDLAERGHETRIVIEGSATKLIKTYHDDPQAPFAPLYRKAIEDGLVHAVCDACCAKMGSKDAAVAQGLNLVGDMKGHPSMGAYVAEGFEIVTF